jgi:hypothetical protein
MPEKEQAETVREDMKFEFKDIPSREEVKAILKTGKGVDGTPVHETSRKLLRTARLIDLETIGEEVNRANKALDDKINSMAQGVDKAISEDRTNFFAFMTYLVDRKILPEDAMEDYYKFKADFIENMNKAGEYLQQKEAEIEKQKEEMIKKAQEDGKPVPELILPPGVSRE